MIDATRIRAEAAAARAQADRLDELAAELEKATANDQAAPRQVPEWTPAAAGLQRLEAFLAALTKSDEVFGARMTPAQKEGCLRLCRAGAGVLPLGWMAYLLATAYHEGGHTMVPIRERGGHAYLDRYDQGRLAEVLGNTPEDDDDGQLYAGRGDVQLTGRRNYERATEKLRALGLLLPGEDLLTTPDLALRPDLSAAIAVIGMREGWFTGKGFNNFIRGRGTLEQFTHARRIINGTDKAALIAGYAVAFQTALEAGGWL